MKQTQTGSSLTANGMCDTACMQSKLPVRMCVHRPAVDVVNEGVDDVSEDEGPGSSQAVLHLFEQQVDKQVVHEEDAMALIAVGCLCFSFTHRQQNPLDRNLRHKDNRENIIQNRGNRSR